MESPRDASCLSLCDHGILVLISLMCLMHQQKLASRKRRQGERPPLLDFIGGACRLWDYTSRTPGLGLCGVPHRCRSWPHFCPPSDRTRSWDPSDQIACDAGADVKPHRDPHSLILQLPVTHGPGMFRTVQAISLEVPAGLSSASLSPSLPGRRLARCFSFYRVV